MQEELANLKADNIEIKTYRYILVGSYLPDGGLCVTALHLCFLIQVRR